LRKTLVESITELAEKDEKLIVLIGDISHYLFREFEEKFPNRFYNVGICEQSIVGLAAGLAMQGFKPIVHTITPFCINRAFEQIKIDVCYQDLNVTFATVGGSFDYSHLGCTHHCYEDISLMMTLPNMEVYNPVSDLELSTLLKESWDSNKPKYFKINKETHNLKVPIIPGEIKIINEGKNDNCVVFVNGPILKNTNQENNTIVYTPNVSELSKESIKIIYKILKNNKTKKIVIIEENLTIGAFGDKILDILQGFNEPIMYKKIGIPRLFLEKYGESDSHRKEIGLDPESMRKTINEFEKL
jgi:transketolase